MTTSRTRFTVPQRLLHWLMALCILSMLFIGVEWSPRSPRSI
jgi:cytochrome b561